MKLNDRILDLREDKDLIQKEIAKYLNMSQTGYSKYETGENDIPTDTLIKLSKFYDTSVDYLLGVTNERKKYPNKINLGVAEDKTNYNKKPN